MGIDAHALLRFQWQPMALFRAVIVPTAAHGPKPFGEIAIDFQMAALSDVAEALLAVSSGKPPEHRQHFWEMCKGNGKDMLLGLVFIYLLVLSRSPHIRGPLKMRIVAADQDQAAGIRSVIQDILWANAWLEQDLHITNWEIPSERTQSHVKIVTSDALSEHGETPDAIALNELVHVSKRQFAEVCAVHNPNKNPNCLRLVATNAGARDSWQEQWSQIARTSPEWRFHEYEKAAPWMRETDREERA